MDRTFVQSMLADDSNDDEDEDEQDKQDEQDGADDIEKEVMSEDVQAMLKEYNNAASPLASKEPDAKVKSDAFHILQRYGRSLSTRSDPLVGLFMGLLTNALFVLNGDDKAKVMKGLESSDRAKLPRRFFYGRCRRRIPKPSELAARLQAVIEIGRKLRTADNQPLFKAGKTGTEATHRNVLKEVVRGHVSDSPKIELYTAIRTHESGFTIFSVARGSSALEGWHRHLRDVLQGMDVSADLADAVLLEYAVRWNNENGIRHRKQPDFGEGDPEILDTLWDVTEELKRTFAGASIVELEGYERTVRVEEDALEKLGATRYTHHLVRWFPACSFAHIPTATTSATITTAFSIPLYQASRCRPTTARNGRGSRCSLRPTAGCSQWWAWPAFLRSTPRCELQKRPPPYYENVEAALSCTPHSLSK